MWQDLCLAAATGAEVTLVGARGWSLARPEQRLWPPPGGQADRHLWLIWALIGLLAIARVVVAVLDFGSLGSGSLIWRVTGHAVMVVGNCLAWWGVAVLGASRRPACPGS